MDQHLGDHQPLLLRHEGLALQNRGAGPWRPAAGPRRASPYRPAAAGADSPDSSQRFRLRYQGRKRQFSCTISRALPATRPASASAGRKARRQGLLAEHVDAAGRGGLDQRRMGFARRGDIDGVELMPGEHRVEVAVDGGDAELRGAAPGLREVGIADARRPAARGSRPGDEMVLADHPGAGEADPQRRPSLRFRCRRHAAKPNRRAGLRRSTRSRSAASGSQRSRAARASP